jgi:hypothetical protein
VAIITLFTKRTVTFTSLQASTSETQTYVKALQVDAYKQGMIVLRAHSRNIDANCSIAVTVSVTAPSSEDPSANFDSTVIGTATIANGTTATFSNVALSNMGGFLKINVVGTKGATGTNITADLSADIVLTP